MIRIRVFAAVAPAIVAAFLASGAGPALAEPPRPPADKPAATDKAPPKVSDADAAKFVAFFDKLVSIAVANQDDCVKMASGFNAHIDANQALLKVANEAMAQGKKLPPAAKQKVEARSGEFQKAVTKKCGNDKTIQAALMRIFPSKMDRDQMGDKDRDGDKDKDKK
jgi:hypothetical protein